MLDLYVNVKNSLTGLESALRIAISNANNFNTPGYKYTYASFTTVYSEAISTGTEYVNPLHTGSAMTLGSTSTDFTQGNLSLGTELDVAIVGEGLFLFSSSASQTDAGGTKVFSRAGRFQTDPSNVFLTDSFGRKVFGYKLDANGNKVSDELVAVETGGEQDIGFIENGVLVSNFQAHKNDPNVRQVPLYKLALTTFQNKQGLISAQGGAYRASVSSGEMLEVGEAGSAIGEEGTTTYGTISAESLESSNVDVAKVALDMNLLNRGFSAVQAVIDDITKILSNIIQKIGG